MAKPANVNTIELLEAIWDRLLTPPQKQPQNNPRTHRHNPFYKTAKKKVAWLSINQIIARLGGWHSGQPGEGESSTWKLQMEGQTFVHFLQFVQVNLQDARILDLVCGKFIIVVVCRVYWARYWQHQ